MTSLAVVYQKYIFILIKTNNLSKNNHNIFLYDKFCFYSYDTRVNTKEAAQWRDEDLFGSRTTVRIDPMAAELIINPVMVNYYAINHHRCHE